MAQSNKQQGFQILARVTNSSCCKTPQTHRGKGEKTHTTNMKEFEVNKESTTNSDGGRSATRGK
eukprot:15134564-Ditylum_brightwellii.AAC.1